MKPGFDALLDQRENEFFFRAYLMQSLLSMPPLPPLLWHQKLRNRVRYAFVDHLADPMHRLACRLGAHCYSEE